MSQPHLTSCDCFCFTLLQLGKDELFTLADSPELKLSLDLNQHLVSEIRQLIDQLFNASLNAIFQFLRWDDFAFDTLDNSLEFNHQTVFMLLATLTFFRLTHKGILLTFLVQTRMSCYFFLDTRNISQSQLVFHPLNIYNYTNATDGVISIKIKKIKLT